MMCILINRNSKNVALDDRLHLPTSVLLSQGSIPPWTTFSDHNGQIPSFINANLHIKVYRPQTTRRPQTPDPIHTTKPIIPTIAPRNSPLLLLGKKGGFRYYYNYPTLTIRHICLCGRLFNCPKHAPNVSASETRLHVISVP